MIWLNLNVQVLDSPEVVGASPTERATWLFLLRYCIGQENGGRLSACRAWKDRRWQQLVRVTQKEVMATSELWFWDGDDLVVLHYPTEKQEEVQANRINGSKGGRPKNEKPKENHPVSDSETNRFEIAETERKGKERKGKELERETEPRARGAPCTEDEAFAYARNLHVTPPFTREAVAKWFSTRSAMHWVRGGVNPIPVTEQTWKDDLRSSHQWAMRTNANGKHQKPLNRMDAEFEIISQDL